MKSNDPTLANATSAPLLHRQVAGGVGSSFYGRMAEKPSNRGETLKVAVTPLFVVSVFNTTCKVQSLAATNLFMSALGKISKIQTYVMRRAGAFGVGLVTVTSTILLNSASLALILMSHSTIELN